MIEAYRYTDEKSDRFWRIEQSGNSFAVNYGKTGYTGKYQVKEFSSSEECEKEAKKMVASKVKKGYLHYPEFDPDKQLYIDDVYNRLLTSHPRFRGRFTEEFSMLVDDEGSDTLSELQDYMKKNHEVNMFRFPQHMIEDIWEMEYFPPDSLDPDELKGILKLHDYGIMILQYLLSNDRVIIASAIYQIKIMGKVSLRLKDLALRSLRRIDILAKLEGYGSGKDNQKMIEELESFQNPPTCEPSETARSLMDYLGCPCEVFSDLLDDDDLIFSYEQALEQGKEQGYTPLLVVVDDILLEKIEIEQEEESDIRAYRKRTIEEALALDPAEVFKGLKEALAEELEDGEKTLLCPDPVKGGQAINRFTAFWDYGTSLSKEVILAKIPTANPWELPVYVPMGGFNECPGPAVQAAVMKYWYEKYGAVPGVVSYSEWEFLLPEPVADKYEALRLACEHCYLCVDRVDQSVDSTIGKLADCLMKSTVWYFWWD